jgi:steroid 5-alpha reductase family enzyme
MTFVQLTAATLAAGCGLSAVMAAAWLLQQRTGRSGWVDVSWSLGVGAVGSTAALWPIAGDAAQWRQVLVAALAAFWSLRLGLHIARRNRRAGDDPRYRQLVSEWGEDAPRRMFVFLQSQAAVGVVLVLAIILAAHVSDATLRLQDVLGVGILFSGIVGEAIADRQLRTFAGDPANRGAVCNVGLWRYSRHPNYFFEWTVWLAYPMIAVDANDPITWLSLAAPACMYWVLVRVSGIPPLEQHMLRTRGEAFARYQSETSPFFPLPRRRR